MIRQVETGEQDTARAVAGGAGPVEVGGRAVGGFLVLFWDWGLFSPQLPPVLIHSLPFGLPWGSAELPASHLPLSPPLH